MLVGVVWMCVGVCISGVIADCGGNDPRTAATSPPCLLATFFPAETLWSLPNAFLLEATRMTILGVGVGVEAVVVAVGSN